MPDGGGMRIKGRVQRAAAAIERQQRQDGISPASGRRSRLGNFGSSIPEARVRQTHSLATIHDSRSPSGPSHSVDAQLSEGFVPVDVTTKVGQPFPEANRGPARPANSVSAEQFRLRQWR